MSSGMPDERNDPDRDVHQPTASLAEAALDGLGPRRQWRLCNGGPARLAPTTGRVNPCATAVRLTEPSVIGPGSVTMYHLAGAPQVLVR